MNRYIRGAALLACVVVPAASASAQSAVDSVDQPRAAITSALPTPPIVFVGITPCRLADTRAGSGFGGFFGPPSMAAQSARSFPVAGQCGIPFSAQAVSANIAVTNTSGLGFLAVWSWGDPQPSPMVASINYSAGQTIANAVLAPLGVFFTPFPPSFARGITVYAKAGLDLIIDVNGYFDTAAAGPTGATGPQGPSGPAGPTGAQGPAGSSTIVQVISNGSAQPNGVLSCPIMTCLAPNPKAVGGGVIINDAAGVPGSSDLTALQYSGPHADLGSENWLVCVKNEGTTYIIPYTAYAICVP